MKGDKTKVASKTGVLLVTRNLPPLIGGMERLNWHLVQELARQVAVYVVGPSGAAALSPDGVLVEEAPLKSLGVFLLCAQWLAVRRARRARPHIVLAGSGLTAPLALIAARLSGARAVAYVHGLDLAVSHRLYRWLWLPALRRMDRVIANSRATRALAIRAGVKADRVGIVHPGVSIDSGDRNDRDIADFRHAHGLGERRLLLSVGRLTQRKGLREFVAEVLPSIVLERPDVMLVVVGYAPEDALYADSQSWASIEAAADKAGVGKHLVFLGPIADRNRLQTVYQSADVHVFPVREIPGDPEGFGMVAVEAAAQGLPTVAYATGGVVDAVAEGVSGYLVSPGDSRGFADKVLLVLKQNLPEESVKAHASRFAWPRFGNKVAEQLGLLAAATERD